MAKMSLVLHCPKCELGVVFDGILVCVPCYKKGFVIHLKPLTPPAPIDKLPDAIRLSERRKRTPALNN